VSDIFIVLNYKISERVPKQTLLPLDISSVVIMCVVIEILDVVEVTEDIFASLKVCCGFLKRNLSFC
jgi:hypothetical protein